MENNYFLVKFENVDCVETTLTGGPWTILGHYLTEPSWNPDFDFNDDRIKTVIAWVRLMGMPIHYYHN